MLIWSMYVLWKIKQLLHYGYHIHTWKKLSKFTSRDTRGISLHSELFQQSSTTQQIPSSQFEHIFSLTIWSISHMISFRITFLIFFSGGGSAAAVVLPWGHCYITLVLGVTILFCFERRGEQKISISNHHKSIQKVCSFFEHKILRNVLIYCLCFAFIMQVPWKIVEFSCASFSNVVVHFNRKWWI